MEIAAMHKIFTRILPAAAVAAGLVFASPASADAAATKTKTTKKVTAKATVACSNTTSTPDAANLEVVRVTLLCLHNQIRANAGLPLLKDNAKLRKAAVGHSNDMVAEGYFDHTSLNGDTFVDRILDA